MEWELGLGVGLGVGLGLGLGLGVGVGVGVGVGLGLGVGVGVGSGLASACAKASRLLCSRSALLANLACTTLIAPSHRATCAVHCACSASLASSCAWGGR